MTSTNIFSGLADEKSSSKVLKPPGGGHTDIFGAPDAPVKKDHGRNASSIVEGTNSNSEKSPTPVKVAPAASAPPLAQQESAAPTGASRSRIPPGGHSSGPLW